MLVDRVVKLKTNWGSNLMMITKNDDGFLIFFFFLLRGEKEGQKTTLNTTKYFRVEKTKTDFNNKRSTPIDFENEYYTRKNETQLILLLLLLKKKKKKISRQHLKIER